jgi:hypothetical protein
MEIHSVNSCRACLFKPYTSFHSYGDILSLDLKIKRQSKYNLGIQTLNTAQHDSNIRLLERQLHNVHTSCYTCIEQRC